MFGYIYPFKPDLKIRYYDTFKSYYCSLCHAIKRNYGNLPRVSINFDTTFMAIFLDSFSNDIQTIEKKTCIIHPIEKKNIMKNNSSINYASHITLILTHNKIIDDINDENNLLSRVILPIFSKYIHKLPKEMIEIKKYTFENLEDLKNLEKSQEDISIDEYAHPFANLTKKIFSFYCNTNNFNKNSIIHVENIGYNLGKWIYLIDAFNDMEKDYKNNSFNPILKIHKINSKDKKEIDIIELKRSIKDDYSSLLTFINYKCLENFTSLSLEKNYDLIENILQLGMPFKIDKIINHFECQNKKGSVS